MRQIWPEHGKEPAKTLPGNKPFNFTKNDWDALQAQIALLQEQITNNQTTFEEAMQSLAYSVTTRLVTTENASVTNTASIYNALVTNLIGETATITNITTDRITAAVQAVIESVVAESLTSNTATINEASITTLSGGTASFDTVSANTFEVDNYTVDNLTVTNEATISDASIAEETVGTSNITDATITTLSSSQATLTDADVTNLSGANNNLENIANEFTTHNNLFNKQTITDVADDYWIVLPRVTNGNYYLVAKSRVDNAVNWTLELTNSTQNTLFRWGVNLKDSYLQDIEIVKDDLTSTEFIQVHAKLLGEAVDLYHRGDDYYTTTVPDVYDHKVWDGVKNFKIERSNGMYMPNATFAGEFHAESLVIDDTEFETITVDRAISLPSAVDQYGQVVTHSSGTDWQYIGNYTDEHGNNYPKWISAADSIEEDNQQLTSSDTVAKYDGKIDNPDYDPTDPDSPEFKYPITNLGDNTDVHGSIKVEGDTTLNEHLFIGTTAGYANAALSNDAIVVLKDEVGGCKVYRRRVDAELVVHLDPIAVMKSGETFDANGILIYDASDDTIKTSLDITVDSETINGNLHVKGDAYVDGTLHTVDEETITSIGDNIVLRANNPSSLGADYSGLIINNYDGLGNSLQLATDSDGTLKLGTGSVTVTTYNDIYYDPTTDKWYSDDELTTEVTPVGWLQSWSDMETLEGGVVHYEDANFAVLYATLEPVMTRDEDNNLNDQGLLIWDAADTEAKTIANPTASEQTLESVVTAGTTTTTTVYTDGTNFYGSDMTVTTEPSGTAGTPVSVGQFVYYDDTWFAYKNSTWYDSVDSWTDDTNWTEVHDDPTLIAELEAQTKLDIEQVTYTEVEDPTVSYQWTTKKPGTYVFATIAAYEQYEIDHPGIIPLGSQVIIEANSNYIKSEDIE